MINMQLMMDNIDLNNQIIHKNHEIGKLQDQLISEASRLHDRLVTIHKLELKLISLDKENTELKWDGALNRSEEKISDLEDSLHASTILNKTLSAKVHDLEGVLDDEVAKSMEMESALSRLAGAVGNPAVESSESEGLAGGLVDFVIQRIDKLEGMRVKAGLDPDGHPVLTGYIFHDAAPPIDSVISPTYKRTVALSEETVDRLDEYLDARSRRDHLDAINVSGVHVKDFIERRLGLSKLIACARNKLLGEV